MNHRDHINAVRAKRLREDLDDEEASRIEALLSAAQQEDRDAPVYRELPSHEETKLFSDIG